MPIFSRRFGIALLVASTVWTIVTASAANLNLMAPATVGAGEQDVTAPCASVAAAYTIVYHAVPNGYYVDAVVLTGTACVGLTLTVRVTIKDGGANPETTVPGVVTGADINAGLTVDVTAVPVLASDFQGLAVLITG